MSDIKRVFSKKLALLVASALVIGFAGAYSTHSVVRAQESNVHVSIENWIQFNDYRELFMTRILSNPEHLSESIELGEGSKAGVASVSSSIQGTPEKPGKSFSVYATQTLGAALYPYEKLDLLEKSVADFVARFKNVKPQILSQTDLTDDKHQMETTELHIAYSDPTYGPLEVKAKFYVTSTTKIVQTALGDQETIDGYRTRDFFDRFKATALPMRTSKTLKELWTPYQSERHMFTAYLPEPNKFFVPAEPRMVSGSNVDALFFRFFDPMLEKNVGYNIYAYQYEPGRFLEKDDLVELISRRHAKLMHTRIEKGSVKMVREGHYQLAYQTTPSKENYFNSFALLHGKIEKNYIWVFEVFAPQQIATSPFISNLIETTEFNPDEANQFYAEMQAEEDGAATTPTIPAGEDGEVEPADVTADVPEDKSVEDGFEGILAPENAPPIQSTSE